MFTVDPKFASALNDWYDAEIAYLFENRVNSKQNGDKHILMAMPLWGMDYMESFVNYSMPSMLARNNANALAGRCTIILFTDKLSKRILIGGTHAFKKYNIELIVREMPPPVMSELKSHFMNVFWVLGAAHSIAMQYATRWTMGFSMAVADQVYSNNYFSNLEALQYEHDVILQTGISGYLDPVCKELDAMHRQPSGVISIDALDLNNLAFRHLHVQTQQYMMNDALFPNGIPCTQFQVYHLADRLEIYSGYHNPVWMSYEKCAQVASSSLSTLDTRVPQLGVTDYYVPQEHDNMAYIEISTPRKGALSPKRAQEQWIDRAWEQMQYDTAYMKYRQTPSIVPIDYMEQCKWMPPEHKIVDEEFVTKMRKETDDLLLREMGASAIRRAKQPHLPKELLTWLIHKLP